jgi:glutamate/aspartate transport system substrate-binding protein
MKPSLLRAAALALAACSGGAQAQGADTMANIKSGGTIVLGVREASVPFSFLNEQKEPAGYSVDLCLAAVEEIRRELNMRDLKVQYRVVTGPERIPELVAGRIDLECGVTTNTKARQAQVDFSYTFFVAGMRVLSPRGQKMDSVQDLGGLAVAVSKGSTSEKLVTQLSASEVSLKLQSFPGNADAYKALKAGQVKAFAQDDSLLSGLTAKDATGDTMAMSPFSMSVEPYAIMMRRNDTGLRNAVDRTLARLYTSGQINALYDKWFTHGAVPIRMSRLTRDSFIRPNREAGVALLLGYSL